MNRLLNMAVSQVHFKYNETWLFQKDGLARGVSLCVTLAYHWLKEYEHALKTETPELTTPANNYKEISPQFNKM